MLWTPLKFPEQRQEWLSLGSQDNSSVGNDYHDTRLHLIDHSSEFPWSHIFCVCFFTAFPEETAPCQEVVNTMSTRKTTFSLILCISGKYYDCVAHSDVCNVSEHALYFCL
jgi:hypothetical protein